MLKRKKERLSERLSERFRKITTEAETHLKEEKGWYNNLKKIYNELIFKEKSKI